ncbi:MAG: cytochrome c oxidase subunit II [Bacteroidota bacterium]
MLSLVLVIAVILIVVIVAMIFRIGSLVSSVKSPSQGRVGTSNKVNAALMMVFLIGGAALAAWSSWESSKDFLPEASSVHGKITDYLFWVTMAVTGIVFVVTHILLFYFPFRYQYKEGNKARFFPDNNKLEIIWTVIPAIVLTMLVFSGWKAWRDITKEAPEDAVVIEVMGRQFQWQVRYPGKNDYKLGPYNFKLIDEGNDFGIDLTDEASFDDFTPLQIHIPKGKPVLFRIRARDVLHSFSIPHLRVKMDAVPGMPTKFWCIPTKTTDEMRSELGNPEFNYEVACQEVCGRGHFSMRMILIIEEEEQYNKWYAEQKSWLSSHPDYLKQVPANLKEKAIKSMELPAEEAATLLEKFSTGGSVPEEASVVNASTSVK